MQKYMTNTQYASHIKRTSAWVGKLIKKGVIKKTSLITLPNKKKPRIIVGLADVDIKESEDGTRDAQRAANRKKRENYTPTFDENPLPIELTVASLTDEQRKEREEAERASYSRAVAIRERVEAEELDNAPKVDDTSADWNKYWIMERGLKTALERKKLAGTLIEVSEAKQRAENFIAPIARKMDSLAYDLKNAFPQLDPSVIEYVHHYTNNIKEETQREY